MNPQPRYQPGDKIGGRYQVHRALMGGMGEVYLCLDLEQMVPYALKTFQQGYQSQVLRKTFENEVATWVALGKHPNIVRCFYMDRVDNRSFMFLEWVVSDKSQGTDLRSWLRYGPLDLRLALDIAVDICRGLIHSQEKQPGLVHRDLKPENILVAQGKLAKITDFGLAQVVQNAKLEVGSNAKIKADGRQSLATHNGIVGTPPYMAPEQWRGEMLDIRTDIYAIGCILYEMLTGSQLFQANTIDALCRLHLEAVIPRLTHRKGMPDDLDTLLHQCLAKRQEDRFENVCDLLAQLEFVYRRQFAESPRTAFISSEFTAVDYNNRGDTYRDLKQFDKALADLTQAIKLDPNLLVAYTNRGITYECLRRYDEALADFNQAIQLDPNEAITYSKRGSFYYNQRHYAAAIADFERAIQLEPNYAVAYNGRGVNLDELQQYDEALTDYDKAIELNPAFAQAYSNRGLTYHKLKRYNEALADFDQAIHFDPYLSSAYVNRANTYAALQRYDEALSDFEQAILFDPTFSKTYSDLAGFYARAHQYDEALSNFDKAIELDPFNTIAFHSRGLTYDELQFPDKALADYSQAIHLNPDFVEAYYDRGLTYHHLQRYEEALADHNRAIELDPTDARTYLNRGATLNGSRRYDEALADYARAIELDPEMAGAYLGTGFTLIDLDRLSEALPYLEKAEALGDPRGAKVAAKIRQMDLSDSPGHQRSDSSNIQLSEQALQLLARNPALQSLDLSDADTWAALGVGSFSGHSSRDALICLEQAVALNPRHPDAWYNMGEIYVNELGEFEEALRCYRMAVEINPGDGQAWNSLGFTLAQAGNADEAIPCYERALDINPGHIRAKGNMRTLLFKLRKYDDALLCFEKLTEKQPDDSLNWCYKGLALEHLGRVHEAMRCFEQAVELDPHNVEAYLNLGVILGNQGKHRAALMYFEKAARLGDPQGVQYAAQARQRIGMDPKPQTDPVQAAFDAFQEAASPAAMQQAVARFPLMASADFIVAIEQAIAQGVPPEHRLYFEQRLTWLRQIAGER